MQPFLRNQSHCIKNLIIYSLTDQNQVFKAKKMRTVYMSGWRFLPGRYFFWGLFFLLGAHFASAQCSRCEADIIPPVLLNNFEVEAQYAQGGGPFGMMFKVNHARRFHRLTSRVFGLSIGSYLGPETNSVPTIQVRGLSSDTHLRGHISLKHQFWGLRFTHLELGIYGGIYHFSSSGSFQQSPPLSDLLSQNGRFRGDLGTRVTFGTPIKYTKKRVYSLQLSLTNSWSSILGFEAPIGSASSQLNKKISLGIGLFVTQPFHVPSHSHGRYHFPAKSPSKSPEFEGPI